MNRVLSRLLDTCSPLPLKCLMLLWISTGIQAQQSAQAKFIPPIVSEVSDSEFARYVAKFQELNPKFDRALDVPSYLNSLILSKSPYLVKHATNPIDWKTWSDGSLQNAKRQNKLIFLSIGFFTCYWCQVMEKESFQSVEVATILNQNYLSLKVDREMLPQLDVYMTESLASVKGTAGWPITAVLTPELDIVYIDSYIKSNELLNVLDSLANTWLNTPERIKSQAALYQKIINSNAKTINDSDHVQIDWRQLIAKIKSDLDRENGGFKGAPNFPEASLSFALLNWIQNEPDPELKATVNAQLHNMASKGMYDSIHGGFHRYTSDGQWHIPHYEKMLYTQALMIELYSRAYRLNANPLYKNVVQDTVLFLSKFLAKENGLFMSSVDAVYKGLEGGFYLYNKDELLAINSAIDKSDSIKLYSKNGLFGFHIEKPFHRGGDLLRENLSNLRNQKQLNIDSKVLVAWNALLITGLKEAYATFSDPVFKDMALRIAVPLLEYRDKVGKLHRVVDSDNNGIAATLEDYAYLSRASLDLFDITNNEVWLTFAQSLMLESLSSLWTDEDTFAYSNAPGSKSQSVVLTDGEFVNPKAVMLENFNRLRIHQTMDPYREQFQALLTEMTSRTIELPKQQLFAAKVLFDLEHGRLEPIQHFAQGNGRVELKLQPDNSHLLIIQMKKGWHVNSHIPLQPDLIATHVEFGNSDSITINYPQPVTKAYTETNARVSVFDDRVSVHISGAQGIGVLNLQACSTVLNLCLQPEKLKFYFGD